MSNNVFMRPPAASAPQDRDGSPALLVQDVVVSVCTVTLAALCLWLGACLLVCLVDALRSGSAAPRTGGALRPRMVQALVASLVSAVAVSAGTGAAAPRGSQLPEALHGLPSPDRAYGGVRTHEVAVGESLWSIAAQLLPATARRAQVAETWPRLHRLNRDRIGADPHLIRPGTTLRLPARAAAPHEGATR